MGINPTAHDANKQTSSAISKNVVFYFSLKELGKFIVSSRE
jgi:hypothetical protein